MGPFSEGSIGLLSNEFLETIHDSNQAIPIALTQQEPSQSQRGIVASVRLGLTSSNPYMIKIHWMIVALLRHYAVLAYHL